MLCTYMAERGKWMQYKLVSVSFSFLESTSSEQKTLSKTLGCFYTQALISWILVKQNWTGDLIKLKNFCTAKEAIDKTKRHIFGDSFVSKRTYWDNTWKIQTDIFKLSLA